MPLTKERIIAKLKGALRSAVVWFNATFSFVPPLVDYLQYQLPVLQPYVPEHLYGWSFAVIAATNLLLRFKTKTALEDKAP